MRLATFTIIWIFTLNYLGPVQGSIPKVIETFNGDGEHSTQGGFLPGLDNPGWLISGNGELVDGGYLAENSTFINEFEQDRLVYQTSGQGSFVSRLEIKNPWLGDVDLISRPSGLVGRILFLHDLNDRDTSGGVLSMNLSDELEEPGDVEGSDLWRLTIKTDAAIDGFRVPRGSNVAFEISFDHEFSEVTFSYDSDISDEDPPIFFGPLAYEGTIREEQETQIVFGATGGGIANGLVDNWSLTPMTDLIGDFNGNAALDVSDIDALNIIILANAHESQFDLNADAVVNSSDLTVWVHDLANTYFGDSNLDGEFASSDLVNVFVAGEYEDDIVGNSTWMTGDWNGDGDFTSSDIVLAFEDGGYERGPRAAVVPEPNVLLLMSIGLLGSLTRRL